MGQKIAATYSKLKEFASIIILGIAIAIFTFPSIHLSYNIGIDPPMMWISNFFFNTQWEVAQNVIFPHGPLAFLVYPTISNIELAISVEVLLKIFLSAQLVRLIDSKNSLRWLIGFVGAYGVVLLSNFIFLLIFSIVLSYCNYFETSTKRDKYIALLLTGFAFYIKSYVGIITCIISGSFLLYEAIVKKKYKLFIVDALVLWAFIFTLWLAMYGTGIGFFRYCFGLFNLAQDNSSAAAYYPVNNWWYLTPFLIFTFGYPLVYRSKRSLFFAALTTLSLFAAWKHGMAREDVYHIRGTYHYAIITFLLFYIFNRKQQLSFLVFAGVALALFNLNMQNAYAYQARTYPLLDGVVNLVTYIERLDAIKVHAQKVTQKNIASNRLPQKIVQEIGNATVDVYPWDYTIIPANGFNFQPRPILQSYAAYTSWLDLQDANHFKSDQAPTYLIWDLNKITTGLDIGTMSSLDYRHLLNDEPQTMLTLLQHYELWYQDKNYLVYKQRKYPLQTTSSIIRTNQTTWGEWVKSPSNMAGLLRAKLSFDKALVQRMKSFFYKDEQFFIYLKFADHSIQKYRIVPKNAVDGLWINPFVIDPTHPHKQKKVVAIALDASNKKILTDALTIDWEITDFVNAPNCPNSFFGKNQPSYATVAKSIQLFEYPMDSSWTDYPKSALTQTEAFSGKNAFRVEPSNYSCSYKITLDSSWINQKIQISTSCWVKGVDLEASKKISLVTSIEHEKESLLWKNEKLSTHLLDGTAWNGMTQHLQYTPQKKGEQLQVYCWNNSQQPILIDDLQVSIQLLKD